ESRAGRLPRFFAIVCRMPQIRFEGLVPEPRPLQPFFRYLSVFMEPMGDRLVGGGRGRSGTGTRDPCILELHSADRARARRRIWLFRNPPVRSKGSLTPLTGIRTLRW